MSEMSQLTATIFDIERSSFVDGPGIRTTVFFKGCNLRCAWCHNPESQARAPQMLFYQNKCTGCGTCRQKCPHSLAACDLCGTCTLYCPAHAREICGREYTLDEVLCEVKKDKRFYESSGGGVTFSGGEPLSQSEFVLECITLIDKRLHCAIQTSGFTGEENFERVLDKADYCLFDLKIFNSQRHQFFCGVENSLILKNYEKLVKSGKPFITRVPLIPGATYTQENLNDIAKFMASLAVDEVEVLPYNGMTGAKYASVGRTYVPLPELKAENVCAEEIFERYNIRCKKM